MSPRKISESSSRKQIGRGRSGKPSRDRPRLSSLFAPGFSAVVGTIHSERCLARARTLETGAVDGLELRVDHFADRPQRLLDFAAETTFPIIVTVRAHEEGGAEKLPASRRRALFEQFLPVADMVDIELRSTEVLASVIEEARARDRHLIISHHDFRGTPSSARMRTIVAKADRTGADIVKIAAHARTVSDLSRLLLLFAKPSKSALSVMSMGPWGKAGRLLLACAGSRLNYGYLGNAQVPGQWEATLFKSRLAELRGDLRR